MTSIFDHACVILISNKRKHFLSKVAIVFEFFAIVWKLELALKIKIVVDHYAQLILIEQYVFS